MNITELSNKLDKRKYDPIYLVLGSEEYLQQKAKAQFIKILSDNERKLNLTEYDLNEDSLDNVINDAISLPFLGNFKEIFVFNPSFLTSANNSNKLNELINYLLSPNLSTILIFFAPYKKIDKRKKIVRILKQKSTIIDTAKLSEYSAREAFKYELKKRKMSITSKALQLIIENTNADFSLMMKQLFKISVNINNKKIIDEDLVNNLINENINNNIFNLINAILNKNISLSLKLYRHYIMKNEDPMKLLSILISQIRLLIQVSILEKNADESEEISKLNIHPYRLKVAMEQANNFSINDLIKIFLELEEMEFKIRSENLNINVLFELFILKLNNK